MIRGFFASVEVRSRHGTIRNDVIECDCDCCRSSCSGNHRGSGLNNACGTGYFYSQKKVLLLSELDFSSLLVSLYDLAKIHGYIHAHTYIHTYIHTCTYRDTHTLSVGLCIIFFSLLEINHMTSIT